MLELISSSDLEAQDMHCMQISTSCVALPCLIRCLPDTIVVEFMVTSPKKRLDWGRPGR